MTNSRSGLVTSANAEVSPSQQSLNEANPEIIAQFVQPWLQAVKGPCWTYMTASQNRNAIYVGFTEDNLRRNAEHKRKNKFGFTSKYNVDKLVYLEAHATKDLAMQRESRLKKWNRSWKIALIEKFNPTWDDLYARIG